jgi:type IV pilus assembly protein PilE
MSSSPRPFARAQAGFTLIELMIVVAIVAILASLAYPSYVEYVARGHRSQLRAEMEQAQQWLERYYSARYFYGDTGAAPANTNFAAQPFATSPPSSGGGARYTLAVVVANTGQSYTIAATRAGTMANDQCGNPTITHAGVKGVVDGSFGTRYADAAAAVAACWR